MTGQKNCEFARLVECYSQFYLPILLCAPKHTEAVQGRTVCQNPRSAPEHMKKVLSYAQQIAKLSIKVGINHMVSLIWCKNHLILTSYWEIFVYESSPCRSAAPQFFSPYFSWPDSCTKSRRVWSGPEVAGWQSLLSSEAGVLKKHTAAKASKLPFSPHSLTNNKRAYIWTFMVLSPSFSANLSEFHLSCFNIVLLS